MGVTKIKWQEKSEKEKKVWGKITWILKAFQTLFLAPSLVLNPSSGQTMAMRSEPGIQCPLISEWADACREFWWDAWMGWEMVLLRYPWWWWHVSLWVSYCPVPPAVGGRQPGDSLRFCPMFPATKPPHWELLAVHSLIFPRTPQRANFKWTKALGGREKGRGRRVSCRRKEMAEIASFLFPLSCPR